MLSTAVYYSQSVVLPFLVTAFFSLTLFLAYCCKSRCFVIFSRIFLIILIIIFLLVAVSFHWNGCKRSIGDFSPNSFFSELGDFGLPSCDSASWETSFFFSLTLIRGLRPPEPPLIGGFANRTPSPIFPNPNHKKSYFREKSLLARIINELGDQSLPARKNTNWEKSLLLTAYHPLE